MINLEIPQVYELYISSTGVCTDTRNIKEGCMFFALKGETFNGNNFAQSALQQGAKYVVIDDSTAYVNTESMILVNNVLVTLQQLARYYRLRYKIPVIALTGTNGKTTTKELITAALSTKYNVVSTKGNLNNHIGVPLTLLSINSDTQIAVIEMGASSPGEIEALVKLVCPSFGLITNVGKAHLLGFGSFDGVKKTKGELYDNLVEYRKIAFVNTDNPHLVEMVRQRPTMQIVPYGVKSNCVQIVTHKDDSPFLKIIIPNPCVMAVCENMNSEISKQIALENGITQECCEPAQVEIDTHLIGDYNVDNVLAALCVSTYFAVPTKNAIKAIEDYIPSNNRSQITKTEHNTLIVDTYNANPTSMRASLENFGKLNFKNKMLVLGDMLELGDDSITEHIEIIKLAASLSPLRIFLVGEEFAKAYKTIGETKINIELFNNSLLLHNRLAELKLNETTVFIKGSHGIKLERIFDAL
ncbi:MAG: UDP-N-acetylmuramoyl-tripeptide--D-alanyl-D-alanine ligase [Bacteroidales bacterium]